jgi:HEAT repeat protein
MEQRMRPLVWTTIGTGLVLASCSAPPAVAPRAGAEPATASQPARAERESTPAASGGRLDAVAAAEVREKAISTLTAFASDPAPELRANALEALIPVPSRLEPLARAALTDTNAGVRAVASLAVAKAQLRGLREQVRPLLNDRASAVRAGAILAMQRLGEPVDPSPLAAMLKDGDPAVRAQAAFVLGELGNPSALPLLRSASRDPMTRADPVRVRLLYLQLAEAMVKLGDENAIHELRAALYPARPEDLEATALAAQALGQIGDRGSASQLYFLATRSDPRSGPMPAEVRLAAAGSMGRMGIADAASIPLEFRADPSPAIRGQAALALGDSRRADQLSTLRAMMDDAVPGVRLAAAAGVLRITDQRR